MAHYIGEQERSCVWRSLFSLTEKEKLEYGLFILGMLTLLPVACLLYILFFTPLKKERCYGTLGQFILGSAILRLFHFMTNIQYTVFPHFISYFMLHNEDLILCDCYGFIETFLTTLEIELLTHVCIERYVVAKSTVTGATIPDWHYALFLKLSVFFSLMYSTLMWFFGHYSWDFTCDSCVFDMQLPYIYGSFFVLAIYFLRSVKPVLTMLMMIFLARKTERRYDLSQKNLAIQASYSKKILDITLLNLNCWFPIFAVRGFVLGGAMMGKFVRLRNIYIQWALWAHYASTMGTAVALLFADERINKEVKKLFSRRAVPTEPPKNE